jgi:hypothetical protein
MNDIKVVLKETHPRNGWWNCKVRIGNVGRYYHIGWSTKEHRWAKNSDSDALAEKHSDFILRKAGEAASELIEAYRIPHVVLCWRENISTGLVEEIRLLPAAEFNALRDGRSRFPAWRAYRPDDAETEHPTDSWGEEVVRRYGIQGLVGCVIVVNQLTIPQEALSALRDDLARLGFDFDEVDSLSAA